MDSGKTAIARTKVSAPTQWLIDNYGFYGKILHFGEGKAYQDTQALRDLPGVDSVEAYDPNSAHLHKRVLPPVGAGFDYVVCNYVLNVLPEEDRSAALVAAFGRGLYNIFTVRLDKVEGKPYDDGVITSKGTFQSQLDEYEWFDWIARTLLDRFGYLPHMKVLRKTRDYLMLEVY